MKAYYNYEADWRPYAFPKDESHLASDEDVKERYETHLLMKGKNIPTSGIPILSDGSEITFDGENSMNIIFGATDTKKSRVLVAPYICTCAQAGESMIIPDIKGELSQGVLSPYIRGALGAAGYTVRVINFRDFNCDGINILLEPYYLYRSGNREEAMSEVAKIINAMSSIYHGSIADPFFEKTAIQYLMSVTILMFELCDDPDKINMLSLASYTSEESCENLKRVAEQIHYDNNIMTMLRSIVSEPDKTRMSTLATVNSFFSDFIINEKLLKMLSVNTFSLEEIYKEKTALFIIMPDETNAFKGIVGLLLSQISSFLVRQAYNFGGKLPRRVNYICDEFCQYYIPNMAKNISAHRSRNIRWTIVCQSKKQLEIAYAGDAASILANCINTFFLGSPDTELLEDLSLRAGYSYQTPDGKPQRLISVANLRNIKKGWDYTDVYFASGPIVCVTKLPDIRLYDLVKDYSEPGHLEQRTFPDLRIYSAKQMLSDIYSYRKAYEWDVNNSRRLDKSERKAAERYKCLFRTQNN